MVGEQEWGGAGGGIFLLEKQEIRSVLSGVLGMEEGLGYALGETKVFFFGSSRALLKFELCINVCIEVRVYICKSTQFFCRCI